MILSFLEFLINIVSIVLIPFVYLSKNRDRFLPKIISHENSIWIHAASVGEVNAVTPLLKKLLEKYNQRVFLTTMTRTGYEQAKKINNLQTYLFPFDLPFFVNRFFKFKKPELIVIVETELWFFMLSKAKRLNIPVIISNGRLSEKSLRSYQKFSHILKRPLSAINYIAAQSEEDKVRFEQILKCKISNYHNLKFCLALPHFDQDDVRNKFMIDAESTIIVFGSSRPGEEKLILNSFLNLKKKYSNLKLIIAPRHLRRLNEIMEIFSDQAFSLLSENKETEILIIDSMGLLNQAYSISDIAIVGGSFYDFGGHNPLEPAFYRKPVIIGNFHNSCKSSVEKLKDNNAILISNVNSLKKDIQKLLDNPEHRYQLGENAKLTLKKNSDSLELNLNLIKDYINEK